MNNPIQAALEALALAKQCGGELDLQHYAEAHTALDQVVQAARAYDATLEAAEQPPTGADYEHIMSLLGLRTLDTKAAGIDADSPNVTHFDLAAAIDAAHRLVFPPDARVAGVLVNADIAPVSFGDLYRPGNPKGAACTCFDAVGTENRDGYDLVRSSDGEAYVIVTYADHAKDRGLSHLKAHIKANPAWYAGRLSAWNQPATAPSPT